jgi:hypothetical protein
VISECPHRCLEFPYTYTWPSLLFSAFTFQLRPPSPTSLNTPGLLGLRAFARNALQPLFLHHTIFSYFLLIFSISAPLTVEVFPMRSEPQTKLGPSRHSGPCLGLSNLNLCMCMDNSVFHYYQSAFPPWLLWVFPPNSVCRPTSNTVPGLKRCQ